MMIWTSLTPLQHTHTLPLPHPPTHTLSLFHTHPHTHKLTLSPLLLSHTRTLPPPTPPPHSHSLSSSLPPPHYLPLPIIPLHREKHESCHQPQLHRGVVLKYNANQRYATTAITASVVREVASRGKVPLQVIIIIYNLQAIFSNACSMRTFRKINQQCRRFALLSFLFLVFNCALMRKCIAQLFTIHKIKLSLSNLSDTS